MYFANDRVELHLGDAREVLAGMETESVGLVVVDPPYGVEWQSGFREQSFDVLHGDRPDEREGVKEIITQCVRLVAQQRHIYVFGPKELLDGQKVSEVTELIWDKGTIGAGDLASSWGPQHERVSFTISKHRHAGQTGKGSHAVRLRKGSVLRVTRKTGRKVRHPTEKPVALLNEFIESSSRRGETVLDPCAGSGSTGVAAVLLGRKAILVESHEPYAELAASRLVAACKVAGRGELL